MGLVLRVLWRIIIVDKYFRVDLLSAMTEPQRLIWFHMHRCVAEGDISWDKVPDEEASGKLIVKHLLAGNRGHFSPFEAPQMSFHVYGFNHRTMQQITRHRIGTHFSVQSFRYSGERFAKLGERIIGDERWLKNHEILDEIEALYYLRPVGEYFDRDTGKFVYTEDQRLDDLQYCGENAVKYYEDRQYNKSHEQCAGTLCMDARQHWGMSFNVRSLMHVFDLRTKLDAELEARQLCDLLWEHFIVYVPAVAQWYEENRFAKARLSP